MDERGEGELGKKKKEKKTFPSESWFRENQSHDTFLGLGWKHVERVLRAMSRTTYIDAMFRSTRD